jgi:PDZ domain-containing protein
MRKVRTFNFWVIRISLRSTAVVLDVSWLAVLPAGLWALISLYIPIMGGILSPAETWASALFIVVLAMLSLFAHLAAHAFARRAFVAQTPVVSPTSPPPSPLAPAPDVSPVGLSTGWLSAIPLLLFGDAAQAWPSDGSAWREAGSALAGIFMNLLLAGLAYLLWNAQLLPLINLSMLFAGLFNGWLAVINLIPAYPFDGGRLARAAFSGLARDPAASSRLTMRLGWATTAALFGWGVFLLAQRSRFSGETGAITLAFGLLVLIGLRTRPADTMPAKAEMDFVSTGQKPARWLLQAFLAGLLLIFMFAISASLLLTNDGLEAPGLALSVEPMIEVPASHYNPPAGSFILTSVIPQAPITAGEWLVGQLSPAVKIVPPATIVPENTTPQEIALQGFRMLDESESTAIVVGLQQAGFDAFIVGKGVRVVSIMPESLALGKILPGDVIVGLNGEPIQTPNELVDQIRSQEPGAIVHLQVQRGQAEIELDVPLMPASGPDEPPRLGITIESAGSDASLPFPVKISPQKIVGGPSAGLMFALTVYNLVTPEDLTGGRKIAGTGTINPDGSVGPIGGVEQKVAAAELAGAAYFLSPPENYAAALSVAGRIQVVEIANIGQAIDFLRSLAR